MKSFRQFNNLIEAPETSQPSAKKQDPTDPSKANRRLDYVKKLEKKAKELGTSPGKLQRDVERGLQAVDKPATRNLDKFSRGRQAYATGEPFQPDNNPLTKSGKYPASGKSTLKGRFRYPSVETGSASVDDIKQRLTTRVQKTNIPGIGDDPRKAKEFIDKATANQKLTSGRTNKKVTGSLAKGNLKFPGDESSLYKTLKRDLDLREPTVKGKSGGKLPMPGGYDKNVPGGRTGTPAQQKEYDKVAQAGKKKFDAEIRKKAELPKSVKVGGKTIDLTKRVMSGTGISSKGEISNPFSRKELNLQYKADKLKLDYGGRFAKRDGLTPKQRKAKIKKIKTDINIKSPTITSPASGGRIPATKANLKKYGFTPQTEPSRVNTSTPSKTALYDRGASVKPPKPQLPSKLKSFKDFSKTAFKSKALKTGFKVAKGVSKAAPVVTGTLNAIGNYKAARAQGRSKIGSAVKSAVTTTAYALGALGGGTLGTAGGAITGPGALVTGTAGAVVGGSTLSSLTSKAYDKIFKPPTKKKVKTGIKNSPSVIPGGGTNPSSRRWRGGIAIES